MPRRNDFLEAFLQGLYNSGVGNPAVNDARQNAEMDRTFKQAALNQGAAEKGLVPAGSGPNQSNSFGADHPIMSKVLSTVKSTIFPTTTNPQGLNTAFKPDPSKPSFAFDTSGKMSVVPPGTPTPQGSYPATRPEGMKYFEQQAAATARQAASSESKDPNNPILKAKQIEKDWSEVRKIVNPFRSSGIGGASSVFNKAAVANQAAARGLKILTKPSLTWQELNAYVNSDIASIQRGGTPTDVQLHEANYNTLLGKFGAMKTLVTGKPSTGLVPPETVNQIKQNIIDIIQVDNQIIDDGIGYVESAYPDAIAAKKGTWDGMKNAALKIKSVGQSASPVNSNGGPVDLGNGFSYTVK